jgi:thiol-disulfide isomerase/thioredoxin
VKRFIIAGAAMASLFIACAKAEAPVVRARKPVKRDPSKVVGIEIGNLMPSYSTQMIDGGTFEVARLRGRVVLLNVWATWCGPCRAETPTLVALENEYHDRGLKVVGVSVDEAGVDQVKEFVETEKIPYGIAHDPEGRIANILQTTVLPASVVIDRAGHIVWREAGLIPPNHPSLTKAIESALARK